ncbi:MAG: polysaccharide deacetylase family protein, partial [Candidatus Hydrogenedentes bacterium]|nr:polysaccharide deacetylase family protein [Candidatus Hydrogenedentota bacterium]
MGAMIDEGSATTGDRSGVRAGEPPRAAGNSCHRPSLARRCKFLVLHWLVRALGPLLRWTSRWNENRAGILMYHRVAPWHDRTAQPTWNVTPERFREQILGLLRLGYSPWPLGRLLESLRNGKPIPARVFAVTFDDGYESVHRFAWPILREANVPATLLVATEFLDGTSPFPFDDWGSHGVDDATSIAWRPMRRAQCRELAADPLITLGGHTHSHARCLGDCDRLRDELDRSHRVLAEEFGVVSPPFAFPFGTHDDAMVETVRRSGAVCALTTVPERVGAGADPFRLGRFHVDPLETAETLGLKLDGWFERLCGSRITDARNGSPASRNRRSSAIFALIDQAFVSAAAFLTNVLIGNESDVALGLYFVSYNMLLFLRGIQRQVISIPYTVFLHRIPDDRRAE